MLEIREVAEKLGDVHHPNSAWAALSDQLGCTSPLATDWIQLMKEEGLIDVFALAHPHARHRFTCWCQHTNMRYINTGARIDAFLVDESLWQAHGTVGTALLAEDGQDSEVAALRACTANGAFRPASFEGGGIPDAPTTAYETMFQAAHTGILYTPPEASDHVAVSLLLQLQPDLQLKSDAATKMAQPHKRQSCITSFFKRRSSASLETEAPLKRQTAGAKDTEKCGPNESGLETETLAKVGA